MLFFTYILTFTLFTLLLLSTTSPHSPLPSPLALSLTSSSFLLPSGLLLTPSNLCYPLPSTPIPPVSASRFTPGAKEETDKCYLGQTLTLLISDGQKQTLAGREFGVPNDLVSPAFSQLFKECGDGSGSWQVSRMCNLISHTTERW